MGRGTSAALRNACVTIPSNQARNWPNALRYLVIAPRRLVSDSRRSHLGARPLNLTTIRHGLVAVGEPRRTRACLTHPTHALVEDATTRRA